MTEALSASFTKSALQRRKASNRPFSIRLSEAERQQLAAEAGSQALGTYIRVRLLNSAVRRGRGVSPQHRKVLSELLGKLGQLQVSASLSDLAAAKVGTIALTPDLEKEVLSACLDLRDMRTMLIRALGLQAEAGQ